MAESISKKASGVSTGGVIFLVLFLGLFCAIGILVGTFLSFLPMYRAMQSRSWQQLSCEVISSRLDRNDDTARPDIQYRYHVDDTPYTSSRYNFIPGSTSDISGHQQVIDRHPAGRRFGCYVDPADPTQAVINRDLTWGYFFGLIFFAAFTGIPAVIGLVALRASRRKPAQDRGDVEAASDLSVTTGAMQSTFRSPDFGPIVLSPKHSPTSHRSLASDAHRVHDELGSAGADHQPARASAIACADSYRYELFTRHRGNLRNALRELYDVYAAQ